MPALAGPEQGRGTVICASLVDCSTFQMGGGERYLALQTLNPKTRMRGVGPRVGRVLEIRGFGVDLKSNWGSMAVTGLAWIQATPNPKP